MRTVRLTLALLASTTLAGASALPAADADVPAGVRELLDPVAVARSVCGPTPKHRTEAFKPGVQLAAAAAAAAQVAGPVAPLPLWDNLGRLTWAVTTRSEVAQRYFDQGLRLAYGFNHGEARRAFRAAQAADPGCAMCYWGEAWVLGPNINQPMAPTAVEPAFAAVAKAAALASTASPREQAVIRALARRYSPDPAADRKALDVAYADGMTEAARAFPEEGEVQVLLADALMNLSPWDYWEADGATPEGPDGRDRGRARDGAAARPGPPGRHPLLHPHRRGLDDPGAGRALCRPAGHAHAGGRARRPHARRTSTTASAATRTRSPPTSRRRGGRGLPPRGRADDAYAFGYYPHNVHFLLVSAQWAGTARARSRRPRSSAG
jgi:hypothetical protein